MDEEKKIEVSAPTAEQEKVETPVVLAPVEQPKAEEVEMISLPAHPPKKKPKEDVAKARTIANRYLSVAALEKIINGKKARAKKKAEEKKAKGPETPEEFYEAAQKYATGAECAVPFQEKAIYYRKAADMYAGAGDYQDSVEQVARCRSLADTLSEKGYQTAYREATALKEKAVTEEDWFKAARAFERIPEYRDADEQGQECERRLARISGAKKPIKIAAVVLVLALLVGGIRAVQTKPAQYQLAKMAHSVGINSVSTTLLESIGDYQDSKPLLKEIYFGQAVEKLEAGNYGGAKKLLKKCKDIENAPELLAQCNYYLGLQAVEQEKWDVALERFTEAGTFEDAQHQLFKVEQTLIRQAKLGDRISYGGNEYVVLDQQDDKALLLSVKLYGAVPYNETRTAVTWKDSTMRKTLNSAEYLQSKFSAEEQSVICTVETDKDCQDKVFLLSLEQYQKYLDVMGGKKAIWWLRDNGEQANTALFVSQSGAVMSAGYPVDTTDIQGRAALWVNVAEE